MAPDEYSQQQAVRYYEHSNDANYNGSYTGSAT